MDVYRGYREEEDRQVARKKDELRRVALVKMQSSQLFGNARRQFSMTEAVA